MKKFCLLAIAVLLLLSDEERRQRALDELNRNSELPFALTLDAYYIKDGVIIHLEYHEDTISDLTAYVQSTNVEDVDF